MAIVSRVVSSNFSVQLNVYKLLVKLHFIGHRYEEKLEKQEAYFQTLQNTLAENFERDKANLLAEQKKREQETSAIMRQTQLRYQVRFRRKKEKKCNLLFYHHCAK